MVPFMHAILAVIRQYRYLYLVRYLEKLQFSLDSILQPNSWEILPVMKLLVAYAMESEFTDCVQIQTTGVSRRTEVAFTVIAMVGRDHKQIEKQIASVFNFSHRSPPGSLGLRVLAKTHEEHYCNPGAFVKVPEIASELFRLIPSDL